MMSELELLKSLHSRKPDLVKLANDALPELEKLQKAFDTEFQEKKKAHDQWVRKGQRGQEPDKPEKKTAIPPSHQWQNLRTAVATATCLAEVENYLYYQAGRKVWAAEAVKDVLGPKLKKAAESSTGQDDMKAMKLFIGYLVRAVLAKRGGSGE
ncbi:MAG: hypothetical protein ABIL25_10510 [candidate division WOR-3 bacterium]